MSATKWMIAGMALATAVVGCQTVHRAHMTQTVLKDVQGYGRDVRKASDRIDLRGYSLEQLFYYASTNRPSVEEALLAVRDAELAVRQLSAEAPILSASPWTAPRASAGVGYDAASQSAHLDQLKIRTDGGVSGSLSLQLLVYDFGRYEARSKAAVERLLGAQQRLISTQFSVFEEVSSAYFTVLEKDALLEAALTNTFEYAEHLQQAEDLLKAGEARRLDVLRARQDLATAREADVAASNDVATASAELLRALGIPAGCGRRSDVMPSLGAAALAHLRRGFADTVCTEAEAFAFARTNSPSMRIAQAQFRAASDEVDAAVADLYPSLSASASLNFSDPLWMWRWGVDIAQTLLAGGSKVTAVDRAVVAMQSAAAAIDRVEQELANVIALAISERDNARSARQTAEESLREARVNLATVRAQYVLGDASRVDFTDAVAAYVAALGSRTRAFYRTQRAEARLFSALGLYPTFREETIKEERRKRK